MPRSHKPENGDADAQYGAAANALAANVRRIRERADLTQQSLAERAGLSVNYVQRVERLDSSVNVTLRLLATLATALAVSVHELLEPPALTMNEPRSSRARPSRAAIGSRRRR